MVTPAPPQNLIHATIIEKHREARLDEKTRRLVYMFVQGGSKLDVAFQSCFADARNTYDKEKTKFHRNHAKRTVCPQFFSLFLLITQIMKARFLGEGRNGNANFLSNPFFFF
jgi:hypothetical protein